MTARMGAAGRATVGVAAGFLAALLLAGLVGLLLDRSDPPSPAAARAQLGLQAIGFIAAAVVVGRALGLTEPDEEEAPARSRADTALTVIAVGGACAVGATLAGPIVAELWPSLADRPTPVGDLGIGAGFAADLAVIVVVAGLVPLGEELLFRGALAGAWLRAHRPGLAVLTSTVLFGLAHATVGARTMAVAALLGALLAATLWVSGSLAAPVLAHGVVNATALLEAGLSGTAEVAALIAVVALTTAVAPAVARWVLHLPPGGTLTG